VKLSAKLTTRNGNVKVLDKKVTRGVVTPLVTLMINIFFIFIKKELLGLRGDGATDHQDDVWPSSWT